MGNSGSLTPLSAASSGTGLDALGAAVEPCPDALAACRNLVELFRLTPAQYQVGTAVSGLLRDCVHYNCFV
jgi:hypothetical protein